MTCKKTCKCSGLNLGVKSVAGFEVARQIGFMPYTNSSGDVNSLPLDEEWDKAFWEGKLSAQKFADRLQLLSIDEYNPTTADSTTVERPSGVIKKVRDGVTTYEIWVDGGDGTTYKNLKSLECGDNGFYLLDDCCALAGKVCEPLKINVTQIARGSFDVTYFPATDEDEARIKVRFNIDPSESPVYDIVAGDEIDFCPSGLDSICDTFATPVINTLSQIVVDITAANSKVAVGANSGENLVPAEGASEIAIDWTMTKLLDDTNVIVTTVVESTTIPGRYTIDFPIQIAGDYRLQLVDTNYDIDFTETLSA